MHVLASLAKESMKGVLANVMTLQRRDYSLDTPLIKIWIDETLTQRVLVSAIILY